MFVVENIGEFNLFFPSEDIIPDSTKMLQRQKAENNVFLASCDETGKPPIKITGSYIHAHGPDYYGTPTINYTVADWEELFNDMALHGLDTAVFQASLWHELSECYYPSKCFKGEYRQWNVVEPMLEAANNCGIKIILGGYGSVIGWLNTQDDTAIEREIKRQTDCMAELLQYGKQFSGIYFSPETAFSGHRDAAKEKMLNKLYREHFSRLKEIAPEKSIAMSPASFFTDKDKEFFDFWMNMLDNVPLDILMPQDSIGTAACSLANQGTMWSFWRKVADEMNLTLWAHVEIFDRQSFGGKTPFDAASPQRVAAQLRNLAPYVEKCLCFEYPYFANNAKGGKELKEKIF